MTSVQQHASTQDFIEIVDIADFVVLLKGGYASTVIEVTASNFALLSQKEQEAKIISYASLLNSLTFPIQILIRNKRIDISSYIKTLEEQEQQTQNPLLAKHIKLYRSFVHEMVKVNVVLNKTFYICIPFSPLEAGISGARQVLQTTQTSDQLALAKKLLQGKADAILPQLQKLAVSAKVLDKEELIKLLYDIYNDGDTLQATASETGNQIPFVKTTP